jgi:hypothetical protein
MDTSGRRSVTFVTILSLVFFLSGVTVGGVSGCYIGKSQAELAQCGLGTILSPLRDECIIDKESA